MIAQYMGQKNGREVSRGFLVNLFLAVLLAAVFTGICIAFPGQIMRVYTKDAVTRRIASGYLGIIAFSYIPIAVSTLLSTLLRCMEAASLPLYASIFGAVVNTGLNYVLIFGKLGFPELGVTGAALATVISQTACFLLTMVLFYACYQKQEFRMEPVFCLDSVGRKQYLGILLPILMCELFWSFGENVYTAIYGNIGTVDCAAMTLTLPVQALTIGALNGLAQAAAILIGKALGSGEDERAYQESKTDAVRAWGLAAAFCFAIACGKCLCKNLSGGGACPGVGLSDFNCLCNNFSNKGSEYDIRRRHIKERRQDKICDGGGW